MPNRDMSKSFLQAWMKAALDGKHSEGRKLFRGYCNNFVKQGKSFPWDGIEDKEDGKKPTGV